MKQEDFTGRGFCVCGGCSFRGYKHTYINTMNFKKKNVAPIFHALRWKGRAFYFWYFFCGRFWNYFWVPGSMLSCFSAFLLFAFPASLVVCLSASLLYLLLFFSASLLSLLLCFCASVPFYFYYSTFSFLQSCVFAALLPAPLLLCFLSLLPLCFFFSFALFSDVCKHPR